MAKKSKTVLLTRRELRQIYFDAVEEWVVVRAREIWHLPAWAEPDGEQEDALTVWFAAEDRQLREDFWGSHCVPQEERRGWVYSRDGVAFEPYVWGYGRYGQEIRDGRRVENGDEVVEVSLDEVMISLRRLLAKVDDAAEDLGGADLWDF